MATLVIVGGVCIVVVFSKKTSQHYTIDELEHMFTQDAFLSVAGVLLVILLGMFLTSASKYWQSPIFSSPALQKPS